MIIIKQEVIRRIDSLGRVVLPIHLRKKINLGEDDQVEIELKDDEIIVRKHEFLLSNITLLSNVCEAIYKSIGGTILIVNQEYIITSYGEKSNVYVKDSILSSGSKIRFNELESIKEGMNIIDTYNEERSSLFIPIIGESNKVQGMLVYLYNDILKENNRNIISSYAIFLSVLMR